jgi:hypothetical protein
MSNQQKDDDGDEGTPKEDREAEDSADEKTEEDENERGEGHGNLHRRSDWFQKRHGGG